MTCNDFASGRVTPLQTAYILAPLEHQDYFSQALSPIGSQIEYTDGSILMSGNDEVFSRAQAQSFDLTSWIGSQRGDELLWLFSLFGVEMEIAFGIAYSETITLIECQ